MDIQAIFIITKFLGSLVFAAGGLLALKYGYQLYLKKVGQVADASSFKILNMEITPRSIGAVMMVTSVAWGYLSYSNMPKTLAMNPANGSVEIASLSKDFGLLMNDLSQSTAARAPASLGIPEEALALKITDKPNVSRWLQNNPEELQKVYRELAENYAKQDDPNSAFTIKDSTITTKSDGKVQVNALAMKPDGEQVKLNMKFVERDKELVLEIKPKVVQPIPEG